MSSIPDDVQSSYGLLPKGWRLERLKFSANVRNSNVDKVISDDEEAVLLCNYTDVYYNDKITPDLEFKPGSATAAEIERFQLKCGQVILTKDSESWEDIGIPALVTEDMPGVLCGYHLAVLDPVKHRLDGGYLAWLCRSEPLNDQFKLGANGVTRFGLGQYPLKNAFIALPCLKTQRRIAKFLDDKTARIDALIEKKRALLDRLAEKRQALITHAVTKGLDPDAPMKDSGIDWLGEIPTHWKVLPLKRIKRFLTSGSRGWAAYYADEGDVFFRMTNVTKEGIEIDESDVRYVNLEGVNEGTRTAVRDGDILITITAELGSVAIVRRKHAGAYINQHLALFRCDETACAPSFLVNFLTTSIAREQFLLNGQGGTKQGLGFDQVNAVMIGLPPLFDQEEIAERCTRIRRDFDPAEGLVRESLSSLSEYRAALITAAVTGQLDLQAA